MLGMQGPNIIRILVEKFLGSRNFKSDWEINGILTLS
jgi:hypothetical protein